ncbi:MAG: ABC transporter ATP-binding protein [Alphaproteobacteria bacterium]|nr:ABC transporter ATP-binding protein [Alphaproteobacteria bacterium]
MSVLALRGVSHRFGDVEVLRSLDLVIEGPGVFGFLGVNGSGKSTTMRLVNGFLKLQAGTIEVLGQPAGPRVDRARVGYLPQAPAFHPWMKAREWMAFTGAVCGLSKAETRARGDALLERLGLADAAERRIGGFSGGMKQRLGLAQALLPDPALLLLDEPVSALDPVGRKELLELIQDLGRRVTVFMSTHILADVERVCDRVAILHQGRVLVNEPTSDILARYVYPVLEMKVDGPTEPLVAALRARPWVQEVEQEAGGALRIAVTELGVAQRAVAGIVADNDVGLVSLHARAPDLEAVFLAIIGAGDA